MILMVIKTKKIKAVLTLLFLSALLAGLKTAVFADDHNGYAGDYITWDFYQETGTLTITGRGEMYNWTSVPPWSDYKDDIISVDISEGITNIADDSFGGCENLKTVYIPKTLTKIGKSAFEGCTSLEGVVIPEGLSVIEAYTFRWCTSLENVIIPEGVVKIEQGAFLVCESLTKINIPASVVSIGEHAFSSCINLESFKTAPDSKLTEIDGWAFFGCYNLTGFTVPGGVTSIGKEAFADCTKLASVKFLGDAPVCLGEDIFRDAAEDFILYYHEKTSGWTDPWNGYQTKMIIFIYGDINEDGEVGIDDLVRLSRHIAEIDPIDDPWQLKAADVTGDGRLTIADLIKFARYMAGYYEKIFE